MAARAARNIESAGTISYDDILKCEKITNCCAGMLIHGFGHNDTNPFDDDDPTHQEIEDYLVKQTAAGKDMFKFSFAIAFLNNQQDDELGHIFKKVGFKCIAPKISRDGYETTTSIWLKELFN